MNMNDLRNDNDMKWHDRMTNDNLVLAVLATLAAATGPHPHPTFPRCDRGPPLQQLTHYNSLNMLMTLLENAYSP